MDFFKGILSNKTSETIMVLSISIDEIIGLAKPAQCDKFANFDCVIEFSLYDNARKETTLINESPKLNLCWSKSIYLMSNYECELSEDIICNIFNCHIQMKLFTFDNDAEARGKDPLIEFSVSLFELMDRNERSRYAQIKSTAKSANFLADIVYTHGLDVTAADYCAEFWDRFERYKAFLKKTRADGTVNPASKLSEINRFGFYDKVLAKTVVEVKYSAISAEVSKSNGDYGDLIFSDNGAQQNSSIQHFRSPSLVPNNRLSAQNVQFSEKSGISPMNKRSSSNKPLGVFSEKRSSIASPMNLTSDKRSSIFSSLTDKRGSILVSPNNEKRLSNTIENDSSKLPDLLSMETVASSKTNAVAHSDKKSTTNRRPSFSTTLEIDSNESKLFDHTHDKNSRTSLLIPASNEIKSTRHLRSPSNVLERDRPGGSTRITPNHSLSAISETSRRGSAFAFTTADSSSALKNLDLKKKESIINMTPEFPENTRSRDSMSGCILQ